MNRRCTFLALAALALAMSWLLSVPASSFAQHQGAWGNRSQGFSHGTWTYYPGNGAGRATPSTVSGGWNPSQRSWSNPTYPPGFGPPVNGNAAPGIGTEPSAPSGPGNAAPFNGYSTPEDTGSVSLMSTNYQQGLNPPTATYGPALRRWPAFIDMRVPANAQVYFDNTLMAQTGIDRTFVTPPLDRNRKYSFQITARWMENGKEREVIRTVPVVPGRSVQMDLTTPGNK